MAKSSTHKKPTVAKLVPGQGQAFAEEGTSSRRASAKLAAASRSETAPLGQRSGLVPEGDVRLTANIRGDLHLKLKIRAAQERTTIGELIEQWVEGWE